MVSTLKLLDAIVMAMAIKIVMGMAIRIVMAMANGRVFVGHPEDLRATTLPLTTQVPLATGLFFYVRV